MTITISRRTILIATAGSAFLLFACIAVAIAGFALFGRGSVLGSSGPSLAEYQECVREERARNPHLTGAQQIQLCGVYTGDYDVDPHYVAYVCGDQSDTRYWEYVEEYATSHLSRQALCNTYLNGNLADFVERQPGR